MTCRVLWRACAACLAVANLVLGGSATARQKDGDPIGIGTYRRVSLHRPGGELPPLHEG